MDGHAKIQRDDDISDWLALEEAHAGGAIRGARLRAKMPGRSN